MTRRDSRPHKWDKPSPGQVKAWEMVRSGMSFRQVAKALGVSRSTVQQRIEAMRRRQELGSRW